MLKQGMASAPIPPDELAALKAVRGLRDARLERLLDGLLESSRVLRSTRAALRQRGSQMRSSRAALRQRGNQEAIKRQSEEAIMRQPRGN